MELPQPELQYRHCLVLLQQPLHLHGPVAAPWLLVQCWTGEYIAYAGSDGDMERITYLRGYNDEEVAVDTWLQNGIPTYAEVSYGGVRCLTITISKFQYTA